MVGGALWRRSASSFWVGAWDEDGVVPEGGHAQGGGHRVVVGAQELVEQQAGSLVHGGTLQSFAR